MTVWYPILFQILSEGDRSDGQGLSLRQLVLWTFDPLQRLKCLATIVDVCRGKKGGALASALYSYMQHGDPFVQSLIQHILNMVCFRMVLHVEYIHCKIFIFP